MLGVKLPGPIQNVIDWLRFDLPAKVDRRTALIGGGLVAAAVLIWALAAGPLSGDDQGPNSTRVVTFSVATDNAQEAGVGPLGFPLVATRNTTRVGGPDATVDAAATALATHPPAPGADTVEAAVLVPDGNWQAGVAASVLAGPPLRAPILIGTSGGVPDPTADALALLKPRGSGGSSDVAVYRVDGVAAPPGLKSEVIQGSSPAELAGSIDELSGRLLGRDPGHVLVVSSEQPAYAIPAAAWAARSGDPVLFSGKDQVPEATLEALERHNGTPVYVVGPESVISNEALGEIDKAASVVQRVGAEGPVANAVAFARYADADFGWNINDPGHGLVVANSSRPLDATAAAALSASGKWGPLLVTDTADALPAELRSFLLDIKPGYETDPTRALYNHIWLIGDTSAIGARVQAEIDDLAELTQIGSGGPIGGTTDSEPGTPPSGLEVEPQGKSQGKGGP